MASKDSNAFPRQDPGKIQTMKASMGKEYCPVPVHSNKKQQRFLSSQM
jgi:hypothetical protein